LPAVPRLIRLLLVCLLAAAMPLKGMAAVVMLACGAMHGAAATALHAPAGHHGQAGHLDHADHAGHAGHQRSAMQGSPGSHGPHAAQAHHAAAADPDPDHVAQGHHAVPGHHVQAGQADADEAIDEAIDAASLQFEHKCAACAACGAAAALPAEPPRFAPAEAGPEAFRPLPLSAVRFFTDGPDRPPRTLLA
jgi:hypothetical protein